MKRATPFALLCAAILAFAAPHATPAATPTLRQQAGQRIVFGFEGTTAPPELLDRIRRGQAGGVILYAQNVASRDQVRALTAALQRARPAGDPPLLVMTDQEGGYVMRLPGAPLHSAQEAGALGRVTVERDGRAAARNLRGAGINVDLAPVADVGRIGSHVHAQERSYSTDAARVSVLAGAFARGLRRGGVAAAAKHFPGLGAASDADADSHLTTIRLPAGELRRTDERPFAALARAEVPLVMLSSAVYPALDGRRALFSRRIATHELRGRVGFRGVALADDLDAPVLLGTGTPERRATMAAAAGADLMMFAHSIPDGERGAAALAGAVRSGRLSRTAFDQASERVRALRVSLAREPGAARRSAGARYRAGRWGASGVSIAYMRVR
ncbi:MAG: beta-N-acetylhexosaminidase [Thermoleophilaceae bacterium]|nr:beta-N-acetylhexosaminidase [Thermoleophilaceae bacterium]